ncbi:MAG: hypothetical protein H2212_03435 [Ruminococcus sp.]|nr:hypothetical protein [Ruminococcus sp.]
MKTLMEEYGKIIAFVILMGGLIVYMFSHQDGGFLQELSKVRAVETVGDADNAELLSDVGKRSNPTLNIKTKKLRIGTAYNLLDKQEYVIEARNADSTELAVSITSIVNPEGEELLDSVSPESFRPDKTGVYAVTYETHEEYMSFLKSTEKTYQFVAD